MRSSLLYFLIYTLTLMFFAKPIDAMMGIDAFYGVMLAVVWVAISAAIVHIIHFWPSKVR